MLHNFFRKNSGVMSLNWIKLSGCLYEKKCPGYSPVNRVPQLAEMILIFVYMRSFARFARMYMPRGIVLSLAQFDFSYSSAIITLNSAFIIGLSASKSNPMKAICDL